MRLYSVALTSLAIDAPTKWTDNLIAHHQLQEVRSTSRGVARGVSWVGLVRIGLIRVLHLELGCGVREAVALSGALLRSPDGSTTLGRVSVRFDREAFEHDLRRRLAEAMESAPRPRRGRPARRRPAGAPGEPLA